MASCCSLSRSIVLPFLVWVVAVPVVCFPSSERLREQHTQLTQVMSAVNQAVSDPTSDMKARLDPMKDLVMKISKKIQADADDHVAREKQLRAGEKMALDRLYQIKQDADSTLELTETELATVLESHGSLSTRAEEMQLKLALARQNLTDHQKVCLAQAPLRQARVDKINQDLLLITSLKTQLDTLSPPDDKNVSSENVIPPASDPATFDDPDPDAVQVDPDVENPDTALSKLRASTTSTALHALLSTHASASTEYNMKDMKEILEHFEEELKKSVAQQRAELDHLQNTCTAQEAVLESEVALLNGTLASLNDVVYKLAVQKHVLETVLPSHQQAAASAAVDYEQRLKLVNQRTFIALSLLRGYQQVLEVARQTVVVVQSLMNAFEAAHVTMPDLSSD